MGTGKLKPDQVEDGYKLLSDSEYTALGGGDAILFQGFSKTFNSTTGVICTHSIGSTAYQVVVTATSNPGGDLGEIWVIKSTNTCTVYCSGSTTTATCDVIIYY